MRYAILICFWLFNTTAVMAHPFHTSLTEIEYNADEQQLEIAVRLIPIDLEDALSAFSSSNVVLDDSTDNDPLLLTYIQQKLAIYLVDSEGADELDSLPFHLVGKQLGIKSIWIFLTAPVIGQVIKIDNRLLLAQNAQQINTLSIIRQGKKKSHQLTREKTSLIVNFNTADE